MATNQGYPQRDPELICILTRHQPAVFPSLCPSSEELDLVQFWNVMQYPQVLIQAWESNGMFLEFDLLNVEPCIANALRRSLLSEVPSMAPERIVMMNNSSIFTDDMIGSRVGLVPFRADARKFKFVRPGHGGPQDNPEYGLIFQITTVPQKIVTPLRGSVKGQKLSMVNVYASNFKWNRTPMHPKEMTDEKLRPIDDDILLATLHPAQELNFQAWIMKGIGKDHAKFSPVSTAFYRPKPQIRLMRPVVGEEAYRLQKCFLEGVVGVEKDEAGHDFAVIKNERLFSGGRKLFDDQSPKDAVQVGFRENEYIFDVESVGALQSAVLVKEAIKILRLRCEYFQLIVPIELRKAPVKTEDF